MSWKKGGLCRLQGSRRYGVTPPGKEDWLAAVLYPVPWQGLAPQASCLLTTTQPGVEVTSPMSSQMRKVGLTEAKRLPRVIPLGRWMQTQVFPFKKVHPPCQQ